MGPIFILSAPFRWVFVTILKIYTHHIFFLWGYSFPQRHFGKKSSKERIEFGRSGRKRAGSAGGGGSESVHARVKPPFALVKLVETAQHNVFRIHVIWDLVSTHLRMVRVVLG